MTLVLNGTTGVSAVDGSASTPAFQGNDSNTGMFFPAADTIAFSEGGAEVARFDSSGNVGVGTSSPAARLQVTKGAADVARFTNSLSNGGDWEFKIGGGGFEDRKLMITDKFSGADNVRVSLDSSGNLLVGTTSQPAVTTRLVVRGASSGAGDYGLWVQNSAGTETFKVRNDGIVVGLGVYSTTTGSAANMFVATDGVFYRSTSSLKYKQNVQDATHGLAEVMQLRPVTYQGTSENDGDKVFGGLIAEEVHAAGLTEFVQYAEDGSPDALAYGNMVSLCIKAIQELKAEVDALKAQLAGAQA